PTGTIPRRLMGWFSLRRLWKMARGDAAQRERFAASLGTGMLMAMLPIYGIKTVTCLWLSGRFRLHPLVVIATSSLSTPPLGFVFVFASLCLGSLTLHGGWPDLSGFKHDAAGVHAAIHAKLIEWIVGGTIGGAALG